MRYLWVLALLCCVPARAASFTTVIPFGACFPGCEDDGPTGLSDFPGVYAVNITWAADGGGGLNYIAPDLVDPSDTVPNVSFSAYAWMGLYSSAEYVSLPILSVSGSGSGFGEGGASGNGSASGSFSMTRVPTWMDFGYGWGVSATPGVEYNYVQAGVGGWLEVEILYDPNAPPFSAPEGGTLAPVGLALLALAGWLRRRSARGAR